MKAFIIRSTFQRLVLLFIVSVLIHSIVHLAPGEPSAVDPMNPRMKPEDIAKIRAAFHLDDPLYMQYAYWVGDLFSGDLKSFKDNQPACRKYGGGFSTRSRYLLLRSSSPGPLPFQLGFTRQYGEGRCTTGRRIFWPIP